MAVFLQGLEKKFTGGGIENGGGTRPQADYDRPQADGILKTLPNSR
jgi:hypothetical protein